MGLTLVIESLSSLEMWLTSSLTHDHSCVFYPFFYPSLRFDWNHIHGHHKNDGGSQSWWSKSNSSKKLAIVVLIATQEPIFKLFIIVFLEKIKQIYMGEIEPCASSYKISIYLHKGFVKNWMGKMFKNLWNFIH